MPCALHPNVDACITKAFLSVQSKHTCMLCAARAAVETRDDGKYRKMARLVIETLVKSRSQPKMENIGVIRGTKSDPVEVGKWRKTEVRELSAIEDLPAEIKFHIIRHIEDPEDIKNLFRTSRAFRQFYNDYMWDIKRMLFDNSVKTTFPVTERDDIHEEVLRNINNQSEMIFVANYRVEKLAPFFRVMRFINVAYLPRLAIRDEMPNEILPAIPNDRYYGEFAYNKTDLTAALQELIRENLVFDRPELEKMERMNPERTKKTAKADMERVKQASDNRGLTWKGLIDLIAGMTFPSPELYKLGTDALSEHFSEYVQRKIAFIANVYGERADISNMYEMVLLSTLQYTEETSGQIRSGLELFAAPPVFYIYPRSSDDRIEIDVLTAAIFANSRTVINMIRDGSIYDPNAVEFTPEQYVIACLDSYMVHPDYDELARMYFEESNSYPRGMFTKLARLYIISSGLKAFQIRDLLRWIGTFEITKGGAPVILDINNAIRIVEKMDARTAKEIKFANNFTSILKKILDREYKASWFEDVITTHI